MDVHRSTLNENAEYKRAWPGSKFASFDKMASFNTQTVVFLRTYTSVFMRL